MARIALFMGTRPEAIKLAPVIRGLERSRALEPVVVSTGQHREMMRQVVDLFELEVPHDLEVMRPGQSLGSLSARLMHAIDSLLGNESFDFAVVQGDTTTALMASLACHYHRIPVGHVEAGLRTTERYSPFPEEMNRRLAASLATLHFAPTDRSRQNLLREGIDPGSAFVTGNTVVDALLEEVERQRAPELGGALEDLTASMLGGRGRPFVLITGHRRESFGPGFEAICSAIARLARAHADYQWVYPVHLNPAVRTTVHARLGGLENVLLLEPLAYRPFVALMRRAHLILTDSGGVQEEAPSLGKPVLVMRENTERPEGVESGTVRLVGTDERRIVSAVEGLLQDRALYRRMAEAVNPYGDGQAAARIVGHIGDFLAEH